MIKNKAKQKAADVAGRNRRERALINRAKKGETAKNSKRYAEIADALYGTHLVARYHDTCPHTDQTYDRWTDHLACDTCGKEVG